jgi:hypothetical protein
MYKKPSEMTARILIKIILGMAGIPFISVETQSKAALKYLPAKYWPFRLACIIE